MLCVNILHRHNIVFWLLLLLTHRLMSLLRIAPYKRLFGASSAISISRQFDNVINSILTSLCKERERDEHNEIGAISFS